MLRCVPLLLLFACSRVLADGCFIGPAGPSDRVSGLTGVSSSEQKAIIIDEPGDHEVLLLQTTYRGTARDFAWVIPVPSRPARRDVFLASQTFMDYVLDRTRPTVETHIRDPRGESGRMTAAMKGAVGKGPMPPGEPSGSPSVTVYDRMDVGSFDATVLSAAEGGALERWLTAHGYAMPEGAGEVLQSYVDQLSYFVALRIRPAIAAERPVLGDVAPVGIRFRAYDLVYPLTISRISAPALNALTLVVLAEGHAACPELPEATLPLGKPLPKGSSYAEARTQAVSAGGASCVVECSSALSTLPMVGSEPVIAAPQRMHYRANAQRSPGEGAWLDTMHATRLWTLLPREALDDLHFASGTPARNGRLHILRGGTIHVPFWERMQIMRRTAPREPFGRFALFAILGGIAYVVAARALQGGAAITTRDTAFGLASVLAVAMVCLLASPGDGPYDRDLRDAFILWRWAPVVAGIAVATPVALALVTATRRGSSPMDRLRQVFMFVVAGVAIGLFAPCLYPPSGAGEAPELWRLTSAIALGGALALAVIAAAWGGGHRVWKPAPFAIVLLGSIALAWLVNSPAAPVTALAVGALVLSGACARPDGVPAQGPAHRSLAGGVDCLIMALVAGYGAVLVTGLIDPYSGRDQVQTLLGTEPGEQTFARACIAPGLSLISVAWLISLGRAVPQRGRRIALWAMLLGLWALLHNGMAPHQGKIYVPDHWAVLLVDPIALLAIAGYGVVVAPLAAMLAAPWMGEEFGRRVAPLSLATLFVLIAVLMLSAISVPEAFAGTIGGRAQASSQLDEPLRTLDVALERFHKACGCYPAALGDLTADTPTEGVDSSGNPVPIASGIAPSWRLEELPIDPLTGRRDTWTYEPTGSPMVDSGGYEIVLSYR